jgi:hypothetical protein
MISIRDITIINWIKEKKKERHLAIGNLEMNYKNLIDHINKDERYSQKTKKIKIRHTHLAFEKSLEQILKGGE